MRNWNNLDNYYKELLDDIYYQTDSEGHTEMSSEFIHRFLSPKLGVGVRVLDLGCGTGFIQSMIEERGAYYEGITWNIQEAKEARDKGRNVGMMDFNFLEFNDNKFDILLSRHSLEHSPFPVLTLMEWHRVSSHLLALVMPNPDHYTTVGRNHYSVAKARQIHWWLRRAGWMKTKFRKTPQEYWFICEKMPRLGYEGWAGNTIDHEIYMNERDLEE